MSELERTPLTAHEPEQTQIFRAHLDDTLIDDLERVVRRDWAYEPYIQYVSGSPTIGWRSAQHRKPLSVRWALERCEARRQK